MSLIFCSFRISSLNCQIKYPNYQIKKSGKIKTKTQTSPPTLNPPVSQTKTKIKQKYPKKTPKINPQKPLKTSSSIEKKTAKTSDWKIIWDYKSNFFPLFLKFEQLKLSIVRLKGSTEKLNKSIMPMKAYWYIPLSNDAYIISWIKFQFLLYFFRVFIL